MKIVIGMREIEKLRREMGGLRRDFAQFQRQFKRLQVEFEERVEAIHANWERTDQLMRAHTRDMEEFYNSRQHRLARQRQSPPVDGGKVEDVE